MTTFGWIAVIVVALVLGVRWLWAERKPKTVEPCWYCGAITWAGCPNSNQCRRR